MTEERAEAGDSADYIAARLIVDDVYIDAGDQYGDAVRRCINCEFDQQSHSLDTDGMKEAVFQGVILKLEGNLKSLYQRDFDQLVA